MRGAARIWTLLAGAAVAAAGVTPHASGVSSPRFTGAYELDAPPAWSLPDTGSWVKHSSPVVADLDPAAANGPEIVVASLGGRIYALRWTDGALVKAWAADVGTFVDSSPAVADLDGDGCLEVAVGAGNEFRPANAGLHVFDCHGGNHRFWPAPVAPDRANHVGVFSTPAIGDVDRDGGPDIVYGSFNQRIYAKRSNGADLPGWEGGRQNYDTVWSSPALADLDGDGRLEVVIGTDLGGGAPVFGCARGIRGTVSIFTSRGAYLPGWPKCMDTPIWSSPAVRDLNGDGRLDVVVGTNNYLEGGAVVGQPWKVRAWDALSGAALWETPLANGLRVFSSPAVGRVGGSLAVAVGTIPPDNYGEVWLLDAATGAVRWHHEGGHLQACACMFMGSPVIADVTGDGAAEVLALSQDGGLSAWDASGSPVIDDLHAPPAPGRPAWDHESYMFFNSPAVADVDGDGTNDVVMASAVAGTTPPRGKLWLLSTGGTGAGEWPAFKRSPARTSSFGSGTGSVPRPAPAGATPKPRSTVSRPSGTAPAPTVAFTPAPTPEPPPVETAPPSPSEEPVVAAPAPVRRPPRTAVASAAVVLGALAAAAAFAVRRRPVSAGAMRRRPV